MNQNSFDREEGSFQATGQERSVERDVWTVMPAEGCPESPLLAARAAHDESENAAALSSGRHRSLQLTMHGETVSSPLVALQLGMRACSLLLTRVYVHESRQALRRGLQLYAALAKRLQGLSFTRKIIVRSSSESASESDASARASSSSRMGETPHGGKKLRQEKYSQGRDKGKSSNQNSTHQGSTELSLVRMGDSGAREGVAELEESMVGFASEESSDTASDNDDDDNDNGSLEMMAEHGGGLLEVEGCRGHNAIGAENNTMRMEDSSEEFSGDADSDEDAAIGQGGSRRRRNSRESVLATSTDAEWAEGLKVHALPDFG